ncbi:N-formylglutamate amidohydrolase [Nitrosomonas communis]|uniref:Predicted N-formylglutamate amidohydrolase n=1 Tax=Nitrosomonas communis TaxID=44574 RepID=A0A1I4P071_9PROT|nr:N-formylglutamate amidohydrolase [Nitrosomonas communis]SFM21224.1 Predicted N-formylglutamate amidohydrolase [Nitrosomonas communis]
MASTTHFVISCEHGGNRIPTQYRHLFHGFEVLLHSHGGYDRGALRMAKDLAQLLNASLFVSTTSRLLIDLNRSIGHPQLFSAATKSISASIRQEILTRYYLPYRNQVEQTIAEVINRKDGQVIHISSHSFTPMLDEVVRHADIGLLYDPSRLGERDLCYRWQARLKAKAPDLIIRRNYPYAGKADGLTAYLRRQFPAEVYVGIELEINQKHAANGRQHWQALRHLVLETLHDVVG